MNNEIKKIVALICVVILIFTLFSACSGTNGSNSHMPDSLNSNESQDNEVKKSSEAAKSEKENSYNAKWRIAFHDQSLPDEYITPEVIAFYSKDDDGNAKAVNVSKNEVYEYAKSLVSVPRTHFFEQYFPENIVNVLLPVLDYAVAHKYCQFCIPSAELKRSDIALNRDYLSETYRISNYGVGYETVAFYETDNGDRLDYTTVYLCGMDEAGMEKYIDAVSKAEEIVSSVPDGYNEYQTALYLYRYITENVRYDEDDYYNKEDGYNLLYDALILNKTVCAGYTESIYYLYNLAGIECITIGGYLYFPWNNERSNHIWNIAKLDGTYYNFDSTWDEGLAISEYLFFGVSTEDMQSYYERSVWSDCLKYCPQCNESLIDKWDYSKTN
ncbi:MAG: hypothetical protein K6F76_07620 [Clostridiales bacterium]|nr:hypothetical protein [Clostridiales bacterium]